MSSGLVKRGEEVPGERIITSLVNFPRRKVDLIFSTTDPKQPFFIIRSMHFLSPDNVVGWEFRIDFEKANVLRRALKQEMAEAIGAAPVADQTNAA